MIAQSDQVPERFVRSGGKTQFNYNIRQVTVEDLEGITRMSYEYDYVEIEGEVTRSKLIDAVISAKYSKDAEIAMINNFLINKDVDEYKAYQSFRAEVKKIVDTAFLSKKV
jgi:hypothetical protein